MAHFARPVTISPAWRDTANKILFPFTRRRRPAGRDPTVPQARGLVAKGEILKAGQTTGAPRLIRSAGTAAPTQWGIQWGIEVALLFLWGIGVKH